MTINVSSKMRLRRELFTAHGARVTDTLMHDHHVSFEVAFPVKSATTMLTCEILLVGMGYL